jgi:peptidyl-dipeptidase Dcp
MGYMMNTRNMLLVALVSVFVVACGGDKSEQATAEKGSATDEITVTDAELAGNPFRKDWDTPYGVPPFDEIRDEHFLPAVKKGILEQRAEIAAIANNPEAPTFVNTILALEMSGAELSKVLYVFSPLTGTELNDSLADLESIIWPMQSRESSAIYLNDDLWQRVNTVYEQRDSLDLGEQEARLLELTHRGFVRAGAALSPEVKAQVADIDAELSALTTKFAQNLLGATKAFTIEITDEADLAGLNPDFKATLWNDDKGAWVVGLNRSVYETFMTQSENRELREQLFNGYRLRASQGEFDNGPLAIKIATLRAKAAELKGYDSHAHYQLETRMAKTPQGAEDFLRKVWGPGLERAKEERAEMQAMIGDDFTFAAHDWWHYSEKVRGEKFNLDENELKPYFELGAVRNGGFELANRLFGLSFVPVTTPVWNDVVSAFEVKDADGTHLGVFMVDMYARDSKRGGAWMNNYRPTSNINGNNVRPIVTNNMNLSTPPAGEPTLMRFDEVETLFHEFGHGLHGLMTKINYTSFAGTGGSPRDYTEFPAQLLEHWTSQPEMLELYARHYKTGEVIPTELVERMLAAKNHNQGFKTTEYIAASLLDLRWHMLSSEEAAAITDAHAFERKILESYGLIDEIEPRYRTQYFSHTFAGGYSAGYYAYLWSEILDSDAFNAFKEAEDIFDPGVAARAREWIYEAGGLREADELYRNFRGKDPSIEPLLEGRGFKADGSGN